MGTPWIDGTGACHLTPPSRERDLNFGQFEVALLNLGRLGVNQTRTRFFNITNFNPVPVNISARAVNSEAFGTGSNKNKASRQRHKGSNVAFLYRGQFLSQFATRDLVEIFEEHSGMHHDLNGGSSTLTDSAKIDSST